MKLSLSGSLQHNDEGDLKKNILKAAVVFTLSFLHSFLVQFCKCDSTHFLLWTSFQNQRSHKGRNCKSEFFAFINKRSIVEGNISQLSCTCCSIKEAVFTLIGKIAFIATHLFAFTSVFTFIRHGYILSVWKRKRSGNMCAHCETLAIPVYLKLLLYIKIE